MSSKYIKINRKVSASAVEAYYMGCDWKKVTIAQSGANPDVTTVAIATVSGVTVTLTLTNDIAAADTQRVYEYFWGVGLEAAKQGPDFAGIAAEAGNAAAGIGTYTIGGADIIVTIDGVSIA